MDAYRFDGLSIYVADVNAKLEKLLSLKSIDDVDDATVDVENGEYN